MTEDNSIPTRAPFEDTDLLADGLPETNSAEPEWIDLPSGKHVSPKEASEVARSEITRVIILAGPVKSGKTTLVTSIYECLQHGTFGGYTFAGSRSLIAFERICHLARIASERGEADTERTRPTDDPEFLHLRVRAEALPQESQSLLFSDISGEDFRAACDSTEECRRMGIVARADHFSILLDGAKLVDINRRQQVRNEAFLLLRSFLEAGMLDKQSHVQIIMSKLDLIVASAANETESFLARICEEFAGQHGTDVASMRFFRIASRSKSFRLGHNVEHLMSVWCHSSRAFGIHSAGAHSPAPDACEYDHYGERLFQSIQGGVQ